MSKTAADNDLELKKLLVNRRKKMYCNILRHFKERNIDGVVSDQMLTSFKNCYNEFVFDDAKEEYFKIKMGGINGRMDKGDRL